MPKSLLNFVSRLRFPYLFWLTAILLGIDLLLPDPVPFIDELLLGMLTLLFSSWRKRRGPHNDSLPAGKK